MGTLDSRLLTLDCSWLVLAFGDGHLVGDEGLELS